MTRHDNEFDPLAFSLAYHESEARMAYNAQRIQNDVGDYKKASEKGVAILKEIGKAFFQAPK